MHLLASTLSLRAVGPATVLSHKCDILSLLKDNQIMRDNRVPVHCWHLASRRHHTAIPVATQMSLPGVGPLAAPHCNIACFSPFHKGCKHVAHLQRQNLSIVCRGRRKNISEGRMIPFARELLKGHICQKRPECPDPSS